VPLLDLQLGGDRRHREPREEQVDRDPVELKLDDGHVGGGDGVKLAHVGLLREQRCHRMLPLEEVLPVDVLGHDEQRVNVGAGRVHAEPV
jgi:hypothetical protein